MVTIGNIAFGNPYGVWVLLLIFPVIYSTIRNKKFWLLARPASKTREHFFGAVSDILPSMLLVFTILFSTVVFTHPMLVQERVEKTVSGTDLIFVLDLSKSMLAEDMKPNRIEAAKRVISAFVSRAAGGRVGLVIFSGKAFTLIPPTLDYENFEKNLSNVSIYSIRQDQVAWLDGTAIGDGLLLSDSLAKNLDGNDRAIVLVTDGEANVGIDPKMIAKYIKTDGIPVYSIGIGDPNGTELYTTDSEGNKQYFLDNGKPLIVSVDEKLLSYLSEVTNGGYFLAKDTDSLEKAFQALQKKTKKERNLIQTNYYVDLSLYGYLLLSLSFSLYLWILGKRGESSILT